MITTAAIAPACHLTMATAHEQKRQQQQQQQWRRRLLVAALALACCASATLLFTTDESRIVAFRRDHRLRRWGGERLLMESASSRKRVRGHEVHEESVVDVTSNVESKAVDNSNSAAGGMEAKDSQGLLVEIAAPATATTGSQPQEPEQPQSFQHHQATAKIINGVTTLRKDHPYIVRLHWRYPGKNADDSQYGSFCGGSLIAPDVVLTAAHCLGKYEAFVDVYDASTGMPKTHEIRHIAIHPEYDAENFGHDVGLIKLATTHLNVIETIDGIDGEDDGEEYWSLNEAYEEFYDWRNAPPVIRLHRYPDETDEMNELLNGCETFSEEEVEESTTMTVIGYGTTNFDYNGASKPSYDSLQGAGVHYMLNEECNELYLDAPRGAMPPPNEDGLIVTSDMMCANDVREGQDACSGDSGGPLATRVHELRKDGDDGEEGNGGSYVRYPLWTQVGVVSWGIGCALRRFPGVYSRVAHEIDWIEHVICGKDSNGKGGLSPLSCKVNEDGKRQLIDHALEAAMRRHQTSVDGASTSDARRQEVIETENVETQSSSSKESDNRRTKMEFSFKSKEKDNQLQPQYRMESCELLEGRLPSIITANPTMSPTLQPFSTPSPTKATASPTTPPTGSPTTPRPTRAKREPSSGSSNNNNNNDEGAGLSPEVTCPNSDRDNTNQLEDVTYFTIGNNGSRKKEKNCKWVRRKCKKRCEEYKSCCPQTCAKPRCKTK